MRPPCSAFCILTSTKNNHLSAIAPSKTQLARLERYESEEMASLLFTAPDLIPSFDPFLGRLTTRTVDLQDDLLLCSEISSAELKSPLMAHSPTPKPAPFILLSHRWLPRPAYESFSLPKSDAVPDMGHPVSDTFVDIGTSLEANSENPFNVTDSSLLNSNPAFAEYVFESLQATSTSYRCGSTHSIDIGSSPMFTDEQQMPYLMSPLAQYLPLAAIQVPITSPTRCDHKQATPEITSPIVDDSVVRSLVFADTETSMADSDSESMSEVPPQALRSSTPVEECILCGNECDCDPEPLAQPVPSKQVRHTPTPVAPTDDGDTQPFVAMDARDASWDGLFNDQALSSPRASPVASMASFQSGKTFGKSTSLAPVAPVATDASGDDVDDEEAEGMIACEVASTPSFETEVKTVPASTIKVEPPLKRPEVQDDSDDQDSDSEEYNVKEEQDSDSDEWFAGPTSRRRRNSSTRTAATKRTSSSTPRTKSTATTPKSSRTSKGTSARPHVCPKCPRSFARRFNLTIHMATHDPAREKMHKCTMAGCDSAFWRLPDLKRHLRLVPHAGMKRKAVDESESEVKDTSEVATKRPSRRRWEADTQKQADTPPAPKAHPVRKSAQHFLNPLKRLKTAQQPTPPLTPSTRAHKVAMPEG
ncbi:uncharacterized protein EV422DRAFT_346933 [Fimicolochytrium jonesii]|uniref:uncharacterized protein n=1 Tax=Fimicolochytrium jonesii TaxID=1396493 RepID=UPI0022FEC39A|nr:uncharacterized protein EV422DRAFT_346933 [Fimicolochytrium jonesii]KAI8815651.1 hypothetical protein EV422DRAFT_346933 [Fimicolochytrium jonesii]